MKTKILIIIVVFLLCFAKVFALPPETSYVANIAFKAIGLSIDDVSYGPFNVGFTFNFFGNDYTQFYVSSNGLITFGSGSSVYSNVCIPDASAPNNYIGAFWDDIMIDGTGAIYYQTIGAAPNRKLIVQWTNMTMYGSPTLMGTFTAILYETSNNVQVQYRSIVDPLAAQPHGNSATIGLENSTGSAGVQLYCEQAGVVDSEKAFLFTRSGATYTTNANAIYEGVLLVETSPYPGIPGLITPADNATVASITNFQWTAATNATSYSLQISTNSDLSSSTATPAGTNTNITPSAFGTGVTRYWAVWATNLAGTTWSEIRKLTTSATPPLAAVPQTYYVELTQDVTITMSYSGGDAGAKTAIVTSLPIDGALYQYNSGVRGSQITSVPTTLTDASMKVIYAASGASGNGKGNFNFKIHDGTGDSPAVALTVNVSPLGAPNFLNASKSTTQIDLKFDKLMGDPTGKQAQFTVTDGSGAVPISSATLKTGDSYTIVLIMGRSFVGTVNIAYTAGTIASSVGGLLLSFSSQIVFLTSQTISFSALVSKNYGDAAFALTATASSGLGVTFSSSNTSVATISGSTCTITGAGTTTITALQAGNGSYSSSTYDQVLTVNKLSQTITFGALSNKNVGDADYDPAATATSGLAVTYSSGNTAVATIVSNKIHVVGTGSSVITASQVGNGSYNAAVDVPQTLTVGKLNQTISFGALPAKNLGNADFAPGATASSGLTVTYASGNTSVATIVSGNIHIIAAGTTVITASQVGNGSYNAATDVPQTLTVGKANQTITFGALAAKYFDDVDYDPAGSSNSGLTVSYASGNTSVATIISGKIHIVSAGTAIITASQAGDVNYNAATNVPQTLTVNKANQTITYGALAATTYGDADVDPAATSNSGLEVSYASGNTSVATIVSGKIHIISAGTAVITASQAGDANYNAATSVPQTLTVNRANQTIAFGVLPAKIYEDADFDPGATSNSGLSVSYFSGNASVATIVAGEIHILGAGTSVITASQAGDGNYNAATNVPQTLTVSKADQTITFGSFSAVTYGDVDFNPGAISSSGLTVSYASDNTAVVTIVSDKIHVIGVGTSNITASQVGNGTYNPAVDEIQVITINKANLNVTAADKSKTYGDLNPALTVNYSGFAGLDDATVLTIVATAATTATQSSIVGNYAITTSGGSADNYSFTYIDGTLTVDKRPLTVTAIDKTKTYGDTNPALALSYSGFAGTENETILNTLPVATTVATETSIVSSYPIIPAGGVDANYSFIYVNGVLSITKKTITVTADDKGKSYGDANPPLSITYTGLANGEDGSVINTPPSISTTALSGSAVGTYPITLSGGSDDNYTMTLVNGSLIINLRTLTIKVKDQNKTYGDANPVFPLEFSGFVNGDNESKLIQLPTVSTTATQTSDVGTYPINLTGGSDDYYTYFFDNGILTINKKELVVTADNKTKVYGEVNPAFTLQYNGFVNSQDATIISVPPTAITPANETSDVGSYSITPSGGSDNNYSFSFVVGNLIVTKKDLTAKPEDKNRVYGDPNPVLIIGYTGFANGNTDASLSSAPVITTTADALSPAGTYPITLSGGSDANYNFLLLTDGTFTINKRPVTVTTENKTKVYGEVNPPFTALYSGFANAQDISVLNELPTMSTSANETSGAGSYSIIPAGGLDDNYSYIYVYGSLSITKKMLTATADNKFRVINKVNPEFTLSYQGLVKNDVTSVFTTQPIAFTSADISSLPGDYPITFSGGVADNYDFTYVDGTLRITLVAGDLNGDGKISAPEIAGDINGDGAITPPEIAGDSNGDEKIDGTEVAGDTNGDGKITSPEVAGDTSGDGKIDGTEIAGDTNGDGKITSPEVAGDTNGDGKIDGTEIAGDTNGDGKITSPEVAGDTNGDGKIDGTEIAGDTNGDGTITPPEIAGDTNGDEKIDGTEVAGDTNGDATITSPEILGDTNGDGKIDGTEVAGDTNGDGQINSTEVRVIDPAKDHANIDHLFSPNGDGVNDYWKLPKIELYGRVQVKIYNRWGGLIYESSNYQNDWDGTSNGKPVPEGAYFYFLKTEKDGDKTGVINIVR